MPGEPILIVDDNSINLELTKALLSRHGYDLQTAGNADDVVTALRTFRPRLILMDIHLPGMDGLDLTRRLKNDPATKDIIIVAITGYTFKSAERAAFDAGCDGFITKPVDTRSLAGLLGEYLNGRPKASVTAAGKPTRV
jgi:CheY-like chemotaxis protein